MLLFQVVYLMIHSMDAVLSRFICSTSSPRWKRESLSQYDWMSLQDKVLCVDFLYISLSRSFIGGWLL